MAKAAIGSRKGKTDGGCLRKKSFLRYAGDNGRAVIAARLFLILSPNKLEEMQAFPQKSFGRACSSLCLLVFVLARLVSTKRSFPLGLLK